MSVHESVSLWHLTGPSLRSDDDVPTHADIVVVGAGLAGLATARELARTGRRVVVLEAAALGGRTTSRTTGKVSLLQGATISQIRAHAGEEAARAYLDANEAGAQWLHRELAGTAVAAPPEGSAAFPDIWETRDAYTFASTPQGLRALRAEADAMDAAGRRAERLGPQSGGIGMPVPILGALRLRGQAQLHPVRAAARLIDGVRSDGGTVIGGCRVADVRVRPHGVEVETARGRIVADRVVVATGTPILDRSMLFATLTSQRQAVVAFRLPSGVLPPDGMYLSVDTDGRSVRTATDRDGAAAIVVGGGDLVTGRRDAVGGLRDGHLRWTAEHFPGAEPITWWAAQDYRMTTHLPHVGEVLGGRGRVHAITGFAKWGMANAAAAALEIAGDLDGPVPHWHEALRAQRPGLRDAASTAVANAEVGALMAVGWAAPGTGTTNPARARVVRRGLRPVAESRVDGRICRVSAVCSHLGGVVRWNDAESTWDCPLHGSRFTHDGRVIEGPATEGLASVDES